MFDAVKDHSSHVREIFEEACSSIQMWDNDYEVTHKMPLLCNSINAFQREYYQHQKPLLMQTIWKTQGKSPMLADKHLISLCGVIMLFQGCSSTAPMMEQIE